MVIYKTTNLINGKIYVGKDSADRSHYFGSGVLIKGALSLFGKSAFKKEILEFCTPSNWSERERFWIQHFDSLFPSGYNICSGGSDGYFRRKHSEATRALMKASAKIRPRPSRRDCQKISEALKGRCFSAEHRRKLSLYAKRRPYSKETRFKMSQARKGRKFSLETRRRMSLAFKGRIFSEEHKAKISASRLALFAARRQRLSFLHFVMGYTQ